MGASRSAGYTLVEVLTVLVLAAIVLGLAYPRFDAELSSMRTGAALRQLTGDLHLARMLAIRTGRTVVLRPEPSASCTAGSGRRTVGAYRIVVRTATPRIVKRTVLGDGVRALCVEMNGGDSIAFNSRGLLHGFGNRTVWARHRTAHDSLTISAVGRFLRR